MGKDAVFEEGLQIVFDKLGQARGAFSFDLGKGVSGDKRLEIVATRSMTAGDERLLKDQGALMECISWTRLDFAGRKRA